MARRKKTLGRDLLATMDDITDLIAATSDPDRIKELLAQYTKLREKLGELIDTNPDQASAEYKAAIEGLNEASICIRKAIKEMESVANATSFIAKAVELIAQVA